MLVRGSRGSSRGSRGRDSGDWVGMGQSRGYSAESRMHCAGTWGAMHTRAHLRDGAASSKGWQPHLCHLLLAEAISDRRPRVCLQDKHRWTGHQISLVSLIAVNA